MLNSPYPAVHLPDLPLEVRTDIMMMAYLSPSFAWRDF